MNDDLKGSTAKLLPGPRGGIAYHLRKDRNLYLFVLPAVVFYLMFHYAPLYFLQIAFKNYRITQSVSQSPWVGFENFRVLFNSPGFLAALRNTFLINFYRLVFGFPIPLVLAILLNEIRNVTYKRVTQTIIYLPHFISWAMLGGILFNMLALNGGPVNKIIVSLGRDPILFLGDKRYFQAVLVLSQIWKESGWGTIIFLAALTGISPELYEAAWMDGAGRLRQTFHISLPGIKDVIIVLLILRLGQILNTGFEQVLVLQNTMVLEVGDILDTYVYRTGLLQARYSFATAAGIFKMFVAALMLFASDRFAKRLGERGLF